MNGDPSQIDLINKSNSGLIKSKKILKNINEIKVIEFDHTDVVRHPLVTKIIQAYQKILMIKINVLVSNKNWKKYIKNPNQYLKKKLNKLNRKEAFKKKKN